jgi:hypothetical protein
LLKRVTCLSVQARKKCRLREQWSEQIPGEGSQAMDSKASASSAFERNNLRHFLAGSNT